MKKIYFVICGKCRKFKILKYHTFLKKSLVTSIICSKCENEDEKIFKEEESIESITNQLLLKNGKRKNKPSTLVKKK